MIIHVEQRHLEKGTTGYTKTPFCLAIQEQTKYINIQFTVWNYFIMEDENRERYTVYMDQRMKNATFKWKPGTIEITDMLSHPYNLNATFRHEQAKPITFKVTQKHIDKGDPYPETCALALAINDNKKCDLADITPREIRFSQNGNSYYAYPNESVKLFIKQHDRNTQKVKPGFLVLQKHPTYNETEARYIEKENYV